jgi:16S rRNA (guanine966-N2)-methyltransferase
VRIIAGTARGRKLFAPDGRGTRPIADRAKEGIFNMLVSRLDLIDVSVLDLYAGSGSFGLECLSRGASSVTFVEANRGAASVIDRNLNELGFADRARVLSTTVLSATAAAGPVDLAFCDPPYADDPWPDLLPRIDAAALIAHAARPVELTPEWEEVKRKRYGRAHVVLAVRKAHGANEPPTVELADERPPRGAQTEGPPE